MRLVRLLTRVLRGRAGAIAEADKSPFATIAPAPAVDLNTPADPPGPPARAPDAVGTAATVHPGDVAPREVRPAPPARRGPVVRRAAPARTYSVLDLNQEIAARLYERDRDADYAVFAETHADARIVPQRHALSLGADPERLYAVLPRQLKRPVFDGGVYGATGLIIPSAIHLKEPARNVPLPRPEEDAADDRLDGTWLFGGRFQPHFGHLLTESLGRLWYLAEPDRSAIDGIVFLWHSTAPQAARKAEDLRASSSLLSTILDMLKIDLPVRLVYTPTTVERLVVPSQLMALSSTRLVAGHPKHRLFLGRLADAPGVVDGPTAERLFISRSRLPDEFSSLFLEEDLDAIFAEAGYQVVHPQTLPLATQLSLYRSAREIVFAEGSAVHLYAAVARPEQRVAIILRRYPPMRRFLEQLRHSGMPHVWNIDAVSAMVLPVQRDGTLHRPWNTKYSDSALDLGAAVAQLREHGFLPASSEPSSRAGALHAAFQQRQLARAAQFPGRRFELVPREKIAALLGRAG